MTVQPLRLLDFFFPHELITTADRIDSRKIKKVIEEYLGEESQRPLTHLDVFLKVSTAEFDEASKQKKEAELQFGSRKFIEIKTSLDPIPEGLKIEVLMNDQGCVREVCNESVFLFTNFLGPCIAAVLRYRISQTKMLIGITHLFNDFKDFSPSLLKLNETEFCSLNLKEIIQKKLFKSSKFYKLMEKFQQHPSYKKDDKVEFFFAGGRGSFKSIFWRNLVISYAKSFSNVTVVDTLFNPFNSTDSTHEATLKEGTISSLVGITHEGHVSLYKSHDIDFKKQYLPVFTSESNYFKED
jgi:hypothetical protein